jgi:acetyl esterase
MPVADIYFPCGRTGSTPICRDDVIRRCEQMTVSWAHSSPEALRAHHAQDAAALAGDLPADVVETPLAADGAFRGGLLFTPPDCAADAAFVYFHGGGFVAGSPQTHRSVTAWLAKLSGMRVLSACYRLAPEHPFPAQREDAVAACAAAAGAFDGAQVFLAGDSAGACVALWGLRGLDPAIRARVAGLVLLYGGYGLVESDSIARYGTPANGLDGETLAIMYRRLGADRAPIWPLDFAGEITEPAYVLAAALDAVFEDSARLFRSLRPAGSANVLVVVEGQDHGFLKRTGADPIALRELASAARWAVERAGATKAPVS